MSSVKLSLRGRLTVTVINARELKDVNLVDKMDPYVEMRMSGSGERFKTQVALNQGTAPVWNQSFIFNLQGKEDLLHFEVRTKQTLSDDTIGRLDIGLEKLNYRNEPSWYHIFDKNNFSKVTGQLQIQVKFDGDGLPACYTATAQEAAQAVLPQPQQQCQAPPQQYQPQPQAQFIYQQPQPQVVYQPPPQVVYAQPQPVFVPAAQPVYVQQPNGYQQVPVAQPVYQQYPPQQWTQYPGQR